jgi:hypothetical protein
LIGHIQLCLSADDQDMELSMPDAPKLNPPAAARGRSRLILEWSLLGLSLAGYLTVYLSMVYWSPAGFLAGVGVCLLVAVVSIVLQFVSRSSPQAEQSAGGAFGAGNAPTIIADWIRKGVSACRSLHRGGPASGSARQIPPKDSK